MKFVVSIIITLSTFSLSAVALGGGHRIVNPNDFVIDPKVLDSAHNRNSKRDLPCWASELTPLGGGREAEAAVDKEIPLGLDKSSPWWTLSSDGIENMPDGEAPQAGPTLLRTQLAVIREISIFASYVRDFASLEARFNDNKEFSIVLAPSNSAIAALSLKPWEFPTPVDNSVSIPEEEKDRISRHNIMSFIAHHLNLVPAEDGASGYRDEGLLVDESILLGESDFTIYLRAESGDYLLVERKNKENKFTVSTTSGVPIVANVIKSRRVENGLLWVLDESLARP